MEMGEKRSLEAERVGEDCGVLLSMRKPECNFTPFIRTRQLAFCNALLVPHNPEEDMMTNPTILGP